MTPQAGLPCFALVVPNPQGACRPLSLRRFAPRRTRTPWDNLRFPPLRGSPFPCAFGRGLHKKGYPRNGTVNGLSNGRPYAYSCNFHHVKHDHQDSCVNGAMFYLFRLATSPCTWPCYRPFFRSMFHPQNFDHSNLIDDAINHNIIGMRNHFRGSVHIAAKSAT